jgi:DNA repair protein RadC
MGVHDEHRRRLRRQFQEAGESFAPHQLLELLLCYAVPRVDTNPAAHGLVDAFGGIRGVLDAPEEELRKVPGVGEKSAQLIKLAQQLAISYAREEEDGVVIVSGSAAAGELLVPKFLGKRQEMVYMLSLDARSRLLGCDEVAQGSVDSLELDLRRVAEIALRHNAVSIVLAHNHPSGVALPSQSDVLTTSSLSRALKPLRIALVDHIIVSGWDWTSMADSNLI